eukprot:gene1137-12333_t
MLQIILIMGIKNTTIEFDIDGPPMASDVLWQLALPTAAFDPDIRR